MTEQATKKPRKKRTHKPRENLSEQIVVRVTPTIRARLDSLAERKHHRGIGEAVRYVLESGWQ